MAIIAFGLGFLASAVVQVKTAEHRMHRTLRHVPFRRSFSLIQFFPFRGLVRVAKRR